jgi:electron transport complex protein RnfD
VKGEKMEKRLVVSQSPHIKTPRTTPAIMLDVVIALLPAAVMGSIIFGWRALLVLLTCTATAVISEFLFCALTKREQSIGDLTAVITGLLLGLNLRADTPLWQCVLGSVFAIVVVKCLFGGTGSNFANPAVTGRIFMMLCFAEAVSGGTQLLPGEGGTELVSAATPLSAITAGGEIPSLFDMFFGFYGGAIGETCTAALLVGFVYLVIRRVIYFETPLIFIGTVFVLSLIVDNSFSVALYQILSGGLVLGAVFMATDYVTTPITRSGKMIFCLGAGVITFLIRYYGSYPEGVSFAILFMNILSPYIEKWTKNRPLGGKKA